MASTPCIFISGITQGIGRACAERFRAGGWQVAGCARPGERLDALKSLWPDARLLAADLYDPAQVEALARQLADLDLDALLNNAGVFLPGGISTEAPGQLERTLQLNLIAPYHLTRAVLPRMKSRGHGTIVNLGSTAGLIGYPNGGSYCISKFALQGLSRALREELKPTGVRVVSVSPGATLTASWAGTDLPPDRFMEPADVAEAVWLACNLPAGTVIEDLVLRPQLGDLG